MSYYRSSYTADTDGETRNRYKYGFLDSIFIIVIFIIIFFSFSACSSDNSEYHENVEERNIFSFTEDDNPIASVANDRSTQIIVDCVNRRVEVPVEPERIAVLDSFAGEAAVLAGAGSKIVTCPNGTKSDRLLAEIAPEIVEVPVVMSGGAFNVESLMELGADIVIVKMSVYQSNGEKKKLDDLKIPYLVVDYSNMQEQIYALRMVGAAFGSKSFDKANKIADYYSSVIKTAEKIAANISDDEKVRVYHSINQAVMTDGSDSLGNDWITCVGAIDVSAGNEAEMTFENNDYYTGLEQIFKWDPDVMICNEAATKEYLLTDSKWKDLRAIREKKVYNIPVSATRWGQRGSVETYFAILWLGTMIYPEYYSDIDLRIEVESYYRDIIGIEIDDDVWNQIVSGEGIRNASNNSGN